MPKSASTLHDPLISPSREFYQNPYPVFSQLRQEAPIFWSEKGQYWLVTRFADAREILGDLHFEKGFKRWKPVEMLAKLLPHDLNAFRTKSMLMQNPPDHTRLRSLVNKAFTPNMVNQLRPRIEKITGELLDNIVKKDKVDLIHDFAFPLPATVIAEMLGIPGEDRDQFKGWSHAITGALEPTPNVVHIAKTGHAYGELAAYLRPLIEKRRQHRENDLISDLVAAEEDGSKLTEDELLANVILLLIAGHETTTNLIGNGLLALLQNPDQMQLLRDKPELLPQAVQEFLRYDSPVQLVRRRAADDLEVSGQKIATDQVVVNLIGAANRDPAEFANPDTLDITREKARNLAFGQGIHHCVGSSLAETEGQIAFRMLLERLPKLKLAGEKVEYKEPFSLRGLKELWVTI